MEREKEILSWDGKRSLFGVKIYQKVYNAGCSGKGCAFFFTKLLSFKNITCRNTFFLARNETVEIMSLGMIIYFLGIFSYGSVSARID